MKQKQEIKKGQDILKKQEKELMEIHKKHDSKEIALDKLRRERNNLYAAMNSEKYKDFTTIEEIEYKFQQEIGKRDEQYKALQNQFSQLEKVNRT